MDRCWVILPKVTITELHKAHFCKQKLVELKITSIGYCLSLANRQAQSPIITSHIQLHNFAGSSVIKNAKKRDFISK